MKTEEKTSIWEGMIIGAVLAVIAVTLIHDSYEMPPLDPWSRRDNLEQRVETLEKHVVSTDTQTLTTMECSYGEKDKEPKKGMCVEGKDYPIHFIPYQF